MLPLLIALAAHAGDLSFGLVPSPGPDENPAFIVTPLRPVANLWVDCEAGGDTHSFEQRGLLADTSARFELPRDESVTEAKCTVIADFEDSAREELVVPISWSYAAPLSVDLTHASADVKSRTLTVDVTAPVARAEVIAYGAHKKVLDSKTTDVSGGPGKVEVPWVGAASEVVLLDVKLHAPDGAWAGFTYSPWFLDIPHEDVLFESNQAVIRPEEEPKLEATLTELREVLDKYGEVVPVKLYIAGCTDTVGDAAHNETLSLERARAIAAWLRSHGFSAPIFYWGFGEKLLKVKTGDGVDEARNRRALYMVGANPPPPGSGVPSVGWRAL
ncbi:MAG: OmpA family protein [Deltaproteobacteria bacterium]|nr:MAG: OmpA family protein [Deltaproteobacteria bacterium]